MKFIEIAYRLGVIFGIFSFIWFFINIIYNLLFQNRKKSIVETYIIKYIKYFLIVNVTILFCFEDSQFKAFDKTRVIFSCFIILLYLIGKLQNQENRKNLVNFASSKIPFFDSVYNYYAEIGSIVFSIVVYIFFVFNPKTSVNILSNWFYLNILSIENSFIFGTIFKIVGFFILMGILIKLINGFIFILLGKPFMSFSSKYYYNKNKKDDDFDSYEEIKED